MGGEGVAPSVPSPLWDPSVGGVRDKKGFTQLRLSMDSMEFARSSKTPQRGRTEDFTAPMARRVPRRGGPPLPALC